jgi:hypothetical protein
MDEWVGGWMDVSGERAWDDGWESRRGWGEAFGVGVEPFRCCMDGCAQV